MKTELTLGPLAAEHDKDLRSKPNQVDCLLKHTKINTFHMIIGAINSQLVFKFPRWIQHYLAYK